MKPSLSEWMHSSLPLCLGKKLVFKRQMSIAKQKLDNELDLMKFIQRTRVLTMGLTALMSGSQQFYVHKMARLTINDSDTTDADCGDDINEQLIQPDDYRYVENMVLYQTKEPVVKRLIDLYKIEADLYP